LVRRVETAAEKVERLAELADDISAHGLVTRVPDQLLDQLSPVVEARLTTLLAVDG
jgi:hypothetical protein